ncbi:MAG: glycosyltransferase family 39 protein, partial [Anaerolineae bacterium]|nr:glycosyltransferase family 39 protein [Anaerolineae bacterium]
MRFHLLGSQSFWNDEGNSYVQATRALTEIPLHAARDIHPPGYYWLLHGWRLLTGDSEFALRSLSAFASLLTVALTFTLGRRLYGAVAGIAAGLFVALNTFQIYFAQEARMYALLALWGTAGMGALVRLITSPPAPLHTRRGEKTWWALALALINAAGLWTQYAYPFVMLAQGVVFVVWWGERVPHLHPLSLRARGLGNRFLPFSMREKGPRDEGHAVQGKLWNPFLAVLYYILANLLTLLLYLPWLPTALNSVTAWPSTGQPVPLSEAVGVIVGWFTLGITSRVMDASWVAVGLFLLLFGLRVAHPVRALWRLILP